MQFNTFQFFKNQTLQARQVQGIIMRISQAGVYVLIQKYGIEGLIVPDKNELSDHPTCSKIFSEANSDEAKLVVKDQGREQTVVVKLFDHLKIEI